jgi:CRISPR/Cas system CSM-associated protein Csm2 small subunit
MFDDLFIARQMYFSAAQSRDAVMNHPKFEKVVQARKSFMEYFYERYGKNANIKEVGMLQRYIQAERAISQWKEEKHRKNQFRVLFVLYPALVKFSRNFTKQYYSPEGKGFYKAKASFESLAKA